VRSIFITGGTGSFGQVFVRRCLSENIARISIFSRDELKQAEMRQGLNDDKRLRWFIGDVRDQQRLRRALEGVDTVVHAAALKRVEVGEFDAPEMVKTNVLGTLNLIEAATDAGVLRVVALSTDKACQPCSAYGASKLLMEKVILAANSGRGEYGPRFAVARLGNFAGSRGSVIPTWRGMLRDGFKTLPVTNAACTRYWMTADEAVELVMSTAKTMKGGELVTPDLPSFTVSDLAEAMGAEIEIVGLRPGERIHEVMRDGETSAEARMLSIEELRVRLSELA
jgi:UDP-N-acetylglucosamine 4,6-dehydratase/5-epimerase